MKPNKTIRWKVTNRYRRSWLSESVNTPTLWFESLEYKKNKKTIAPKNSLGCFCFKTKKNARAFANIGDKILKIKTYGKGHVPSYRETCCYLHCGTICYPAVMPLE